MQNSFSVQGNLAADAELKYTPNGLVIVNFRIGNTRKYKGEAKTNWFTIDYFGKGAEAIAQYLTKGKFVTVDGRIEVDSYEKDGVKRTVYKIVANEVHLGPRSSGNEVAVGAASDDDDDDPTGGADFKW